MTRPATTGVLCALEEEHVHLRRHLVGAVSVRDTGMRFDTGALDGRPVVLAESGMGKVNAAMVATALVERFGAGALVLAGVAGGLDPGLRVGDVVVADRTVQHDAGMVIDAVHTTYQPGHLPFFNPTDRLGHSLPSALESRIRARLDGLSLPPLSNRAGGSGDPPRVVVGTILTGDRYVGCEDTRERLHTELGGVAVEMEGAAVAQVAEGYGVPWLIVRALSDLAGREATFDFATFADEAAVRGALVLRRLLPALEA